MRLTKIFALFGATVLMLSSAAAYAYDAEFDYNSDGVVDEADLDILQAHFGSGEGDGRYDSAFDHDGDGYVGGTDILAAYRAVAED